MDRNCERPRASAPTTFVPAGRAAQSGQNFAEGPVPNFESRLATGGSRWDLTPDNRRGCGGSIDHFLHLDSETPHLVPGPSGRSHAEIRSMPRRTNQDEAVLRDVRDDYQQQPPIYLQVPRVELRRASSDPGLSKADLNKCYICLNDFSTKGSLTRHMKNMHGAGEREQRSNPSINLQSNIVLEIPSQDENSLYQENVYLRNRNAELELALEKYKRLLNNALDL